MTYCVGMMLNRGLVFMSDTRTNSGIDNINTFRKMFNWSRDGDRNLTVMTAGNLATTQAVVSLLDERSKDPADRQPSLMAAKSMFQAATIIGDTLKEVIATYADTGPRSDTTFNATIILGGQIGEGEPRLFMIYPEGNFIEATFDTPFFQIGETKYGRPILVRAYDPNMTFEQAIKLLMVSFDSTIKANLSVSLPLDVATYAAGSLCAARQFRVAAEDPYFAEVTNGWGDALQKAFDVLPDFEFPK